MVLKEIIGIYCGNYTKHEGARWDHSAGIPTATSGCRPTHSWT